MSNYRSDQSRDDYRDDYRNDHRDDYRDDYRDNYRDGYRDDRQPRYDMPAPSWGGYPDPPRSFSASAITAICTFWVPLVGLVLSIVAMVKTRGDVLRGRGLAITALVLSIIMTVLYTAVGVAIGSKTSALDPGCTQGKTAIFDGTAKIKKDSDPAAFQTDIQAILDQLDAAIASSHRADVKSAMQAIRGDYVSVLQAVESGNIDPSLQSKIDTDAQQVDHLCTIGAK